MKPRRFKGLEVNRAGRHIFFIKELNAAPAKAGTRSLKYQLLYKLRYEPAPVFLKVATFSGHFEMTSSTNFKY